MQATSLIIACILGVALANTCGVPKFAPYEGSFHRIVGGQEARRHSWPWQIHLIASIDYWGIFTSTQAICGGSIVNERWVVTAAHCILSNVKSYQIRVGQHDSSIQEASARNYPVRRVIVHPRYEERNAYDNDIALIELEQPIQFNDEVSAVCLPPSGSDPASESVAYVTGWGETSQRNDTFPPPPAPIVTKKAAFRAAATKLQQVKLNVVERELCNGPRHYQGWVLDTMVCAGRFGIDACQGDSGGPMVSKNAQGAFELVGVVSWGFGCGDANYPGVYSRVGHYIPWINQVTGGF